MKSYLIHIQQAPFANSISLEMQELAFALSSFSQPVSFLFSGDGVLNLTSQQPPASAKDFTKAYQGLDLFDIKTVYVDRGSAKAVPESLLIPTEFIDDLEYLYSQFDVVIN